MTAQTYPPLTGWADYTEALNALTDLTAQRGTAHRDLEGLQRGGQDAAKADDGAQAKAMREGGKDPGRKITSTWKVALEAAQTRTRVLETAISQQQAIVQALLTSSPDLARAAAEQEHLANAEAYRQALDGLLEARQAFWQTRGVLAWAQAPTARYKERMAPGLAGTQGPNGEPLAGAAVLDAFSAEVDPVLPPRKVAAYVKRHSVQEQGPNLETTTRFIAVDDQGRDADGNLLVRTVQTS